MGGAMPIWGFLAVTVPLVLTPGASTAVVLRNSLAGGTRAGLETAVGVNAGSLCYGLLCAFGFALALQQWPGVWIVLRAGGVVYLGWLGLKSLGAAFFAVREARAIEPTSPPPATIGLERSMRNVREGFLTNAANPAIASFYLVVLPQFIPPQAPVASAALLLTAVHVTLAASWHFVWAAAGGTLSRALGGGRPRQVLDITAGVALLLLAARLIAG